MLRSICALPMGAVWTTQRHETAAITQWCCLALQQWSRCSPCSTLWFGITLPSLQTPIHVLGGKEGSGDQQGRMHQAVASGSCAGGSGFGEGVGLWKKTGSLKGSRGCFQSSRYLDCAAMLGWRLPRMGLRPPVGSHCIRSLGDALW